MPKRKSLGAKQRIMTAGELSDVYAPFFESIKAGVVVVNDAIDVTYMNAAAAQLAAVEISDALRKPLSDWSGAEFVSRLRARNFKAVRGMTLTLNNHRIRVIASPLIHCDETIGAVLVMINSNKSLRANPDAFKAQNNLVRTLDRLKDRVFFVTDAQLGQQVFINDGVRKLTGWSPKTLMEGTFALIMALMHPEDALRVGEQVKEVAMRYAKPKRGGVDEPFSFQYRLRHNDGHYVSLMENGCLLSRDTNGMPHYILSFLEAITPKAVSKSLATIHLTNREYEVAVSVIRGNSSKIIAGELGLSVHTVNEVRQNLRKKTGAVNTAALVKYLSVNNIR